MREPSREVLQATDGARLNLILFPTERCNFRCTYCYEDFSVGRMTPQVVQGVKRLICNRAPELNELELSWFGGEPLLAPDIIEDISGAALEAVSASRDLTYTANMTTNGYFLDLVTCTRLVQLGVETYQISLDGWQDIHDRTRRRADGSSTFERIWTNLLAIRESVLPVQILLRVHYSPASEAELNTLIDHINSEFSRDPRFTVYFKSVDRLGGENDKEIQIMSESRKHQIETNLTTKLANPLQVLRVQDAETQYVCYASATNSFAIRPNGSVSKCTVALYDSRNNIGTLRSDGSLALDPQRLLPWLHGLQTLDPKDLACPWATIHKAAMD